MKAKMNLPALLLRIIKATDSHFVNDISKNTNTQSAVKKS